MHTLPGRAWIPAVLASLALAGCATMQVDSYVDRTADFTRYATYDWAPADRLATGDPRLDNNPFFEARLQRDVEEHLEQRGFRRQTSGMPDLRVHYHASVTQDIANTGIDDEYGYCRTDECGAFAYEAGTIVLDLVDTRDDTLVWRGWAEGSMEGAIDDQDWMESRIDEAVGRIMQRLPRAPVRPVAP